MKRKQQQPILSPWGTSSGIRSVSTRTSSLSLSLSPLYNPLKHPSFLAVIFFPMLSASARFDCLPLLSDSLCSSPPTFSPPSPPLPPLPRCLFGELFISLCMPLISTCSKDMIGGRPRWGMGEGTLIRLSREQDGVGRSEDGKREREEEERT